MQSASKSQLEAITHGKGAMLVLAGPGSGKTYTIIQRLTYLIQNQHVDPASILVISFSKASAEELRQRFKKQNKAIQKETAQYNLKCNTIQCNTAKPGTIQSDTEKINTGDSVNFATFHACFFHILKETYHYTSKDIIQPQEKRNIMKTILSDPMYSEEDTDSSLNKRNLLQIRKIETGGERGFLPGRFSLNNNSKKRVIETVYMETNSDRNSLAETRNAGINIKEQNDEEKAEEYIQKISYYKNKGMKELSEKENTKFQSIFHAYNREMHEKHKLDFDDMGLLCLQLFQGRPDILAKWQEKFQYILIDEFQDINPIQFQVIQLLAKKHQNLFVVGDDDQAIYSFRGASPKIMLNFDKFYPDAKKVLLETNFRCSGNVVKKSLEVIEKNKLRFKKEIKAHNPMKEPVIFKGFENRQQEYQYISEQIKKILQQGSKYTDIACIYRTNSDMSGLADFFIRNKIPFVMKEKCNSIFRHFIARDILSYLQFFLEGQKRKDFLVIMNKPLRYLSRNACRDSVIVWQELKNYYQSKIYMQEIIEKLESNQKWVQRLDLYGAVSYIRKAAGYEKYLKEYADSQGLLWEELKEILDFIHNSVRGAETLGQWRKDIAEYEEALQQAKEEEEGICLLTMHACKGLEFPYVFLPDCNEGKVPHKRAAGKEEIEEERRMFYVAMTRAKERLEILYLQDKYKKKLQPSRFLPIKI